MTRSGSNILRIVFFVPVEDAEKVKQAIFAEGAGDYGNYDCCSWETMGTGQFRPGPDSSPAVGDKGKIARIPELRVETICPHSRISRVLQALIAAHPYETPAYMVDEIHLQDDFPPIKGL